MPSFHAPTAVCATRRFALKSLTMLNGDQRHCDVCAEPIPHGVPYRCGYTTPDAVEQWFADDPRFLPTFTQEPDGTVRIDVCLV